MLGVDRDAVFPLRFVGLVWGGGEAQLRDAQSRGKWSFICQCALKRPQQGRRETLLRDAGSRGL
jgi:hypothetical protein